MPDGIAAYESNGSTFLVTANEGDLCKYNLQPYVYTKGQWITLHEAARMIVLEQRENL
jgi:hypothetical protein